MILYIGWLFDAKCVCITVRLQAQLQRCRVCVEYKFGCIVLFWYVVLFFTFATVRMHCVFVRWMNVLQPFCIYVYYILCTIVSCTIVLCSLSSSLLPFFIQWLPFNFYLFFFHFSMCISTWFENFKWEKNYNRFFMGFKMIYMDYPQNVQMNRNLEHLLHNIKINLRIFQKESQTYWLHFNSFQMEPLRIWVIRCFAWNSTNPMVNHDFWQMCFDSQFCFLPSHDSPL